METAFIIDNLVKTFNISKAKKTIVRSNLSRNNFINRTKHTYHIHDVFYMFYAFMVSPGNFKDAKIFFNEMLKNEAFICEAFDKIQLLGFDHVDNITFGYWYIIVNAKSPENSFICGKMENYMNDRSRTISGKQLMAFFETIL